jgi:hypothetical protein
MGDSAAVFSAKQSPRDESAHCEKKKPAQPFDHRRAAPGCFFNASEPTIEAGY